MLDPDESLIRAAQRGDHEALERIWAWSRPWLAALVLAHAPSPGDVDDLLQEVAVSLVRRIGTLEDPGALRPWLRAVALNRCRSAGRKRAALSGKEGRSGEAIEIEDPAPGVARARQGARDRLTEVLRMARRLPETLREPLLLKAVRGMTQRQIAQTLEITEAAVETRLSRARGLLRARIRSTEPPRTSSSSSSASSSSVGTEP